MIRCLLERSFIEAIRVQQSLRFYYTEGSWKQYNKTFNICSTISQKSCYNPLVTVSLHTTTESSKNFSSYKQINSPDKKNEENVLLNKQHWQPFPTENSDKLSNLYKKLAKFRLTSLVVITAMGGYAMAPAAFDINTFAMCSFGTGLISAAANAINQYHEVPFDSQMSRTKNRVLVVGKITSLHAVGFAFLSASLGLSLLYFGVNGLTCFLGLGNLVLYTSIYTPLKRVSILNTWIGSIVGAIPPLIGWAGCAGELSAAAWIPACLLYAWQFPHFNALSWNLRPDYSKAGYRMMAVTDPSLCRRTALRYTVAISALSLLAPVFDVTNVWFAAEMIPLNAYFIYLAYKFYKQSDSGSSRKLFRFSLIHLPALMLLLIFNKKRWIFLEDTKYDNYTNEDGPVIKMKTQEIASKTTSNVTITTPTL